MTRLFVFPHAGGGAGHYRGWADWLPDGVRLEVLDLPGHATRLREPLLTEWGELTADLAGAVRARIAGDAEAYERPRSGGRRSSIDGHRPASPAPTPRPLYVLAGHSLGALLAYEVARIMDREGTPPELLVVSGRNAPTAGLSHRPIHALPDDEFLAALDRLGGTPAPVLDRPDLIRVYLPALRADLRLAESYSRSPGPPLSVPIAAFAGRQDRLTDGPSVVGWARETAGAFELSILPGGHFLSLEPAFGAALHARLARLPRREVDQDTGLATDYSPPVDFIM